MRLSTLALLTGMLADNATLTALTTSPGSPAPAETPSPAQAAPDARPDDFVPDVPTDATTYDNKAVRARVGFAMLVDDTVTGQNAPGTEQVGRQASTGDLRAGRLVVAGRFKFKRPWTCLIAGDFKGFWQSDDLFAWRP